MSDRIAGGTGSSAVSVEWTDLDEHLPYGCHYCESDIERAQDYGDWWVSGHTLKMRHAWCWDGLIDAVGDDNDDWWSRYDDAAPDEQRRMAEDARQAPPASGRSGGQT
jgi:hypothetical protein